MPMHKKSFDYFEYFCVDAQLACRAADFLNDTFLHFSADTCRQRVDEMHQIEHEADMIKHEMTKHLAHEFMTPIEREDIAELAQKMDNVVDALDDVMRKIYMFNITSLRPETLSFTALIAKCCHALETAVCELRNFKKGNDITRYVIEVNTLESEGDALHSDSIHRLFCEPIDARSTIIWMTMFEGLESCLDACEDAIDVIESVVMKNT
ncbi:MAG: DUF47 family protein [Oscillospiraceae bacterium]